MSNPFSYNDKPTQEQIFKMNSLRIEFKVIYDMILSSCPESRERSLALTNLEQASHWANKAISHAKESHHDLPASVTITKESA